LPTGDGIAGQLVPFDQITQQIIGGRRRQCRRRRNGSAAAATTAAAGQTEADCRADGQPQRAAGQPDYGFPYIHVIRPPLPPTAKLSQYNRADDLKNPVGAGENS
jgi:hypothetical protein